MLSGFSDKHKPFFLAAVYIEVVQKERVDDCSSSLWCYHIFIIGVIQESTGFHKKITSVSLITYFIYLISIDDMIKNKTF